ncbi:MAG TPA: lipoprotein-releasing ABC transporter permease subunit [Gammaproteobacteria bacterium]|nr:lipoprotein-releasing ABC transporter permease subunit [Gammaproteobacteria bacterium]
MIRQPYTVSIALRYLRARAHIAFISFISAVSMLGVALAVGVLIIVMAIVNGFETELERRILSVTPDAWLMGYDGRAEAPVDNWPELREAALERDDIEAAAPFVEGQGMLIVDDELLAVTVRGVDPVLETGVSSLDEHIVGGDYAALDRDDAIVIGASLARALGATVGDTAIILLPQARVTPAGMMPTLKTFEIAGIFEVGMQEFDRGLVLVNFDTATTLYRTGGRAHGVSLRVDDIYEAATIVVDYGRAMRDRFGTGYVPEDWAFRHANVFRSIELTKPLLFIMLSLVIVIAVFNIVSTLFMVVREKRGDIAILRTLGSAPRNILSIFIVQGSGIGLIGVVGGLALGLALVASLGTIVGWIEAALSVELFSGDVYPIDDLPTEARAGEITRICLLAFGLAVLATVFPAWRASRQPPAEALRHE